MTEGVDYSFGRPSPAALKAAGKLFAIRYIPYFGDGGKGVTEAEIAALHKEGLSVAFVFESYAGRILEGRLSGEQDASHSAAVLTLLGAPPGQPVYFACDIDVRSVGEFDQVADYMDGAKYILGRKRVGIYGSYSVMRYFSTTIEYLWQTYAWSGGLVYENLDLYQYKNGQTIDGALVDFNLAYTENFGQWEPPMYEDRIQRLEALIGGFGVDTLDGQRLTGEAALNYMHQMGLSTQLGISELNKAMTQHIAQHPSGGQHTHVTGEPIQ